MVKYILARQLVGKKVITLDGYDVGRTVDIEINPVSGKILNLLVEPDMDSEIANKLKVDGGQVKIAIDSLHAVNNYVMVDRKNL
ncbi:MAG: PRC-barrel domain-containing protein [Candidatus Marsarchaeota archaeon]|nr:PRC-barrel domain-containing protein [Candidatus Marsarchaeota archaeon]